MTDEIEIKVDLSKLTFGDFELLEQAGKGNIPISNILDILDKIVIGGARQLPVTTMPKIIAAIQQAMNDPNLNWR